MSKEAKKESVDIVSFGAVRTDTSFDAVLARLKTAKDFTLVEVVRRAAQVGARAFLLCGACFTESCSRVRRLNGGHGKRDDKGVGAQARKHEIAKQMNRDYRTLETDARIYKVFYLPTVAKGSWLERERSSPTLPREFYVTALAAPDPAGALEVALERRSSGHYPVGEFRDYVKTLKKALGGGEGDDTQTPPAVVVRLRLPAEAGAVLESEVRASGKSASEVVSRLLIRLNWRRSQAHKANQPSPIREERPKHATSAAPPSPSLFDLAEGEGGTQ